MLEVAAMCLEVFCLVHKRFNAISTFDHFLCTTYSEVDILILMHCQYRCTRRKMHQKSMSQVRTKVVLHLHFYALQLCLHLSRLVCGRVVRVEVLHQN